MSVPSTIVGPRVLVRLTRGVTVVVGIIAVIASAARLIGGTVDLVDDLVRDRWRFTLISTHPIPSGTDHGPATIVHGTWDTADLVLSGVTGAPAVFSVIASVAGILTPVVFGALVALLCWRLLRGRMFRRSLSLSITIMGAVVSIGGLLTQGAGSLASGTAAALLNGGACTSGFWPLGGRLDPTWPIVGFVLMLVGLAFEYGERLQGDVDGLV